MILKYQNDLSNHNEGKRCLYRSRKDRKDMNEEKKATSDKDTWFRKGGATSTLTVPATPGGILAEKVRKNLESARQPTGTRTKVIEDGGVGSKVGLVSSNQFPHNRCHRNDCIACTNLNGDTKRTNCMRNNVGYRGKCSRCEDNYTYIGETSRTMYTRGKEHIENYRSAAAARLPPLPVETQNKQKRNVKSWMWEHTRDHHNGVMGTDSGMTDYKFEVTGSFSKCLQRQVDEDVRIQKCEAECGKLLNSKYEYFTPKSVQVMFKQW